jgi:hypothetical protein
LTFRREKQSGDNYGKKPEHNKVVPFERIDGDLMGDGVNIAARLEGIAKPGAICLSEDAYRQVKARLDLVGSDQGAIRLKNIAEPAHVYSLEVGSQAKAKLASGARQKKRSTPVLLGMGILALILIVGGAWYFLSATRIMPGASNVRTESGLRAGRDWRR